MILRDFALKYKIRNVLILCLYLWDFIVGFEVHNWRTYDELPPNVSCQRLIWRNSYWIVLKAFWLMLNSTIEAPVLKTSFYSAPKSGNRICGFRNNFYFKLHNTIFSHTAIKLWIEYFLYVHTIFPRFTTF